MILDRKQREFNAAMARYEGRPFYRRLHGAVSGTVLLGQALLLLRASSQPPGWGWGLASFAIAYLLTDLLNGLIHLVMDHQDRYQSWAGPLVAAFHLHHRAPRYQDKPLWAVYIHESGFKIWLPFYLLIVLALSRWPGLPNALLWLLVWVGVLSSVAEVSHYLCHNSTSRWAAALARAGLLLDKGRHARHHREDNVSYAFLNGLSNPLIDWIARRCFGGYKSGTDQHYAAYQPGSDVFQR